jgi:hypothetical protein
MSGARRIEREWGERAMGVGVDWSAPPDRGREGGRARGCGWR